MAKINNIQKLTNQVNKNKGFKELVSNILNNSIVTGNSSIIIEDNPGYLNNVLEILDDYEISDDDVELLAGAVVKSLGKTKILHNNDSDLNSLIDNFGIVTGEDSSMHITGDIFQVIKTSLPDMTDSDAGNCAVYIAMSLALRSAFPEGLGVESSEEETTVEETSSEEKPSELSGMDLTKFLKNNKKEEELKNPEVAASDSTKEVSETLELGEEIILGNGHKAHKVKRVKTEKSSGVIVAASDSTKDKIEITEENIRKEFDEGVKEIKETCGEEASKMFTSIFDIDALVKEIFEKSKTDDILADDFMNKFFADKFNTLDEDKKNKFIDLFNKMNNNKAVVQNQEDELMKGIKINDDNINAMFKNDNIKLMIKCMSDTVLKILDDNRQDMHDLATAAKSGNKNIFYHTLANICEGDQSKAEKLIEAINNSEISGLKSIHNYTVGLAFRKNEKLATC